MTPRECIDASALPFTREGFYATNNQFQRSGPQGFMEIMVLENTDLYVRIDLPGVPDDAVLHRIDGVRKKVVFFAGETPPSGHHETMREYSGCTGLGCDCCEITGVNITMKDGVLRMVISRIKVKDDKKSCTLTVPPYTGKSGRYLEDHPFVVKGPKGAHFAKPTEDGRLFATFDVPGASADDIRVSVASAAVEVLVSASAGKPNTAFSSSFLLLIEQLGHVSSCVSFYFALGNGVWCVCETDAATNLLLTSLCVPITSVFFGIQHLKLANLNRCNAVFMNLPIFFLCLLVEANFFTFKFSKPSQPHQRLDRWTRYDLEFRINLQRHNA